MTAVLLIEDDPVIARAITTHLRHNGFEVQWAETGPEGLEKLRFEAVDIAVVDLMLPGLDGWAITEAARTERPDLPIIAVSARASEHDKVHTLGIGADDYLAKPFGMRELVARINAVLRRAQGEPAAAPDGAIVLDGLRVDPNLRRAFLRVEKESAQGSWPDARLTPIEFRLVHMLARNAGRVMTRDELQQSVWGSPYRHRDRTVDVCVRRIREKLDRRSPDTAYLHTHYGIGYRLAAEPRDAAEAS